MSPLDNLDEVRRLEQLAFRGWPALESRDVDGWRLRFANGYTKRANSINALGDNPSLEVEALEAPFRARNQRPAWRLSPLAPSAMAGKLGDRGYSSIERSLVQRCPLHEGFSIDPAVEIADQPSAAWLDAFCIHSPVRPEHRETMERMLAAIAAPKAFALVQSHGRPMAMAIGALDGDHMGLFDVLVMPDARRQGLARRVTESLYTWARHRGAGFAYLQVVATNAPALALYEAQGFRTLYAYNYWLPPG